MALSFLARFTLVTFLAAVFAAVGLAYILDREHQKVLESDLITTSVGQTSALLSDPLSHVNPKTKQVHGAYAEIAKGAAQAASFQEYVRDVHVYWPDGTALFPAGAAPERAGVAAAIETQNVYRGPEHLLKGERILTGFIPIATGANFSAVIAIDYSVAQMRAQDAPEQRFVIGATLAAVTLIFLSLVALAIAAQRELNRRQRLADTTFVQTIGGIAQIVDKRDPYTAGHSQRVANYSRKLAVCMRCVPGLVTTIEHAALLHDLGKIGIPDSILLKPGKFDDRERSIIQFHPDIAAEILGEVEAMRTIVPCIVHHHERWDGAGYPRKLQGSAIPLGARIIAVADTYDAMTTDRPYRRALSVETARAELLKGAGTQWDAECVHAFIELIDSGAVVPPPPITDAEVLAHSFGQQVPPEFLQRETAPAPRLRADDLERYKV
ncbi:MAG: HD-GYP domain-containing protein [Candidatus Eremiobacteraeota bacterium]|nr:HD-GYP domain-containing protein [Candidatus Eremiobacteraeota bacterium]